MTADPSASYCSSCCLELSALPDASDGCPLCFGVERFATVEQFDAALRRWAGAAASVPGRLSEKELGEFLLGTFVLAEPAALYASYRRGDRLEVVCDPFARAGGGPVNVGPTSERAPTSERLRRVPLVAPSEDEAPVQRFGPAEPGAPIGPGLGPGIGPGIGAGGEHGARVSEVPRALLYPLASVAAADGIVEVEERWYIDTCMKRYGLAPATEAEIVVYYPLDHAALVPPAFRETLVVDMCALAMIDGLPDAAEARMIYAYCTEWRIPEDYARAQLVELQKRNTSLARRAWLGFRNYLLPGRWENTKL